jgi:hypothetical protein
MVDDGDLQNSSPVLSMPSSLPFFPVSRQCHSHSGYSSSGSATGSSLPLRKFNPFRDVPAGAIETGRGVLGFGRKFTPRETALGAGERGVEKGCAALVDVAAEGLDGEELGVGVVRERTTDVRMRKAEARWRQRWQIMTCLCDWVNRHHLIFAVLENVTAGETGGLCGSISRDK